MGLGSDAKILSKSFYVILYIFPTFLYHELCRSAVSSLTVLQRYWGYSEYTNRFLRSAPSPVWFQAAFSACDKWEAHGRHLEVGHSGASRLPHCHYPIKVLINIILCMHMELYNSVPIRNNTGCIIKCAPLRAHCQQCANREGNHKRHWHRKDFPHWRKAFYFSHSSSPWMR